MPNTARVQRMIQGSRNFWDTGGSDFLKYYSFFDDFIDGRGFTANNDAIGSAQGKYSELANMGTWLATVVDGGTDSGEILVTSDDEPGGVVTMTTNDADDDLLSLQMNGEAWKVAEFKDIWFVCRFKITDVSECDWFVGLATTDTAVVAGTTESIGFRCDDSTGDIDYIVEDASTETTADTGVNLSDGTFVKVGFHVQSNDVVEFMIDDVIKARVTDMSNLPEGDAVTLTMEIRNDGAAANTLEVDYIGCAQLR